MSHQKSHRWRLRSRRLQNYDYSRAGYYFVTIRTNGCQPFLAKQDGETLPLTEWGRIAEACWKEIPTHFPTVKLDACVIMPNHIHGIVGIFPAQQQPHTSIEPVDWTESYQNWPLLRQGTASEDKRERFSKPVPGSLPTIIRSYKAAVTKAVRERVGSRTVRVWDANYWDHVVRSARDLRRIRGYISRNPRRWIEKHRVKYPRL